MTTAPSNDDLRREVARRFPVRPAEVALVRSPYRVCPLGAHIDHQNGPVTAFALDRNVRLAFAPSGSRACRLASLDFDGEVAFSLDDIPAKRSGDWGNFPRGVAAALGRCHALGQGVVGVLSGSLHGGGVSSSAAVTVALLMAFERANGLDVSAEENVTLGREVENDYLGLRSGILDQAAILHSRRDALTLIDCATGGHERLAAPRTMPRFTTVLAFSGLRQALVGTDYNRRVDECAEAACVLLAAAGRPDQRTLLGNVQAAEYQEFKHLLKDAPARRAAHFFGEVDRVRQGVDAWKSGDLARFGGLMTASGASSIELYECGSPPLIDLYHLLVGSDGVLGARFSGAGFRGCCVALASPDAAEEVAARVRAEYARKHPDLADNAPVVLCSSDDGAEVLT